VAFFVGFYSLVSCAFSFEGFAHHLVAYTEVIHKKSKGYAQLFM
jgi:hypothetical protein